MKRAKVSVRVILFLVLLSLASNTWALDEDDQDSADSDKKDTTSKTEGASAGSGRNFDPPHDDHPNTAPPVATHASGASAPGGASLAEAATDPSAVLTQFQNFFWTTGSSDDKNISNTYLLQPVLPLTKNNVLLYVVKVFRTATVRI